MGTVGQILSSKNQTKKHKTVQGAPVVWLLEDSTESHPSISWMLNIDDVDPGTICLCHGLRLPKHV